MNEENWRVYILNMFIVLKPLFEKRRQKRPYQVFSRISEVGKRSHQNCKSDWKIAGQITGRTTADRSSENQDIFRIRFFNQELVNIHCVRFDLLGIRLSFVKTVAWVFNHQNIQFQLLAYSLHYAAWVSQIFPITVKKNNHFVRKFIVFLVFYQFTRNLFKFILFGEVVKW